MITSDDMLATMDKLELEAMLALQAAEGIFNQLDLAARISTAVSLKRLADEFERWPYGRGA